MVKWVHRMWATRRVGRAATRKHVEDEADIFFEKQKNMKEKIKLPADLKVCRAQNVYNESESLNPYYNPPLHP